MTTDECRYAHELHPEPADHEQRNLPQMLPYLFARAIGLRTFGTGWYDLARSDSPTDRQVAYNRTDLYVHAGQMALLADALAQGLTGAEAWRWVSDRSRDNMGEWLAERASAYGVDSDRIAAYPCIPTRDTKEAE